MNQVKTEDELREKTDKVLMEVIANDCLYKSYHM